MTIIKPQPPYLSLNFTAATSVADVLAAARAAISALAPEGRCDCGTTPDLIVNTTAGTPLNITSALQQVEMALRSGDIERVSDETLEDATEYLLDTGTVLAFDAANVLRKRLARNKATASLPVRPGIAVSTEGYVVPVVGIGHLGDETGDKVTLVSAVDLLDLLHHEAPRARGTTLLDTLASAVEAYNPAAFAHEDDVRYLCEGDTVHTVYCDWDGEEFYRNAVEDDDDTAAAPVSTFGRTIVGEA